VRLDRIIYSVLFDAEVLKCALIDMVEEAGVKVYLHNPGTRTIMEGTTAKGVIFESKSADRRYWAKSSSTHRRRRLFPSAGIGFDADNDSSLRIGHLSMCYWISNVDLQNSTNSRITIRPNTLK
jgi:hypothetical protein